jgi:hypothetical protein
VEQDDEATARDGDHGGSGGERQDPAGGDDARRDDWPGYLREVIGRLGIALLALGGLVAFVAAVGGAIAWTRFRAAERPADQALDKLPQGELVATGAVTLALYGVLGLFAAAAVYLIDSPARHTNDRRSRGLSRGLLLLVAAESLVLSMLLVEDKGWRRFGVAAMLLILVLLLCLVITRAPTRWAKVGDSELDRDFPSAKEATIAFFKRFVSGVSEEERRAERETRQREEEARREEDRKAKDEGRKAKPVPCDPLPAVTLGMQRFIALVMALTVGCVAAAVLADTADRVSFISFDMESVIPNDAWTWPALIGLSLLILIPGAAFGLRWAEDGNTHRPSPESLYLTREGGAVMFIFSASAIAAPALVLWEWWIAAAVALAVLLGVFAWMVASRAVKTDIWYSVVVFASVPFLGAAVGIIRNAADPQVQPLAFVHVAPGQPAEAIQGIYVTETDDTLYFASVATDRCGNEVVDNSGRMLSVPQDEVRAMMLGPAQSVGDAGRKSVEMFQALTGKDLVAPRGPRLEVIGATPGDPTLKDPDGDGQADEGAPVTGESAVDPRPERGLDLAAGPTLRREFTEEQRLSPSRVHVGQTVALIGDGFDDKPLGRTVHVGGLVAPLANTAAAEDIRESTIREEKEVSGKTWTPNRIRFTVPEGAEDGVVTLECRPLVGRLKLRIKHPPNARLVVTPDGRSQRLTLDSAGSHDSGEGQILARSWQGDAGPRQGARAAYRAAPSLDRQWIRLTVTDDDAEKASAGLAMWRLPLPGAVIDISDTDTQRAIDSIRQEIRARRGDIELVVHSHVAASAGTGLDARARAEQIAANFNLVLFGGLGLSLPPGVTSRPPVVFGDRCVLDLDPGADVNGIVGQLDVFAVRPGTDVRPPADC